MERRGLLDAWHDRRITSGEEWSGQISDSLERADIVLLLISADFMASDYCYEIETKRALELHAAGKAVVIPVILRPVSWRKALAAKTRSGAEINSCVMAIGNKSRQDAEADGTHSTGANGDDNTGIDDEDGIIFGTIRAGQLAAAAMVNVRGGAAKLDAWIDFNRDGAWGGPLEQIADRVPLVTGDNTFTFDVPSWAADGTTYARFRLSTEGNLGVGGVAADGEVEDHAVTILPPKPACGCFSAHTVSTAAKAPLSVFASDVDGDGDTDVLSASLIDNKIAWYENDGNQNFTPHTISTGAN